MIKFLIKEYRRRRILRDIKKAKRYFQVWNIGYMCSAFMLSDKKYHYKDIYSIIPEFNRDFLNAKYEEGATWWDRDDRESRIKAFDKLIETYSKKEQQQKKN